MHVYCMLQMPHDLIRGFWLQNTCTYMYTHWVMWWYTVASYILTLVHVSWCFLNWKSLPIVSAPLYTVIEFFYWYVAISIAEKATEILREVKGAQEAFRKQKDLQKLETEVHVRWYEIVILCWTLKSLHNIPSMLIYIHNPLSHPFISMLWPAVSTHSFHFCGLHHSKCCKLALARNGNQYVHAHWVELLT